MRKSVITLSLAAILLIAAAARAQVFSQETAAEAKGNTRLLLVFSPDSRNAAFRKQYALLEHHGLELTRRDTVVVPFLSANRREDSVFVGENLRTDNDKEQAMARVRYHVGPTDFTVILIDKDGNEQLRWSNPISIHEFVARVDPPPTRGQRAEVVDHP